MHRHPPNSLWPMAGVLALWEPAMIAAADVWKTGEYYDYGWFVPPGALCLTLWRWRSLDQAP